MFDLLCIIFPFTNFLDQWFARSICNKNLQFANVTSSNTVTSSSDKNFFNVPFPFESVVKFLMEFIQELHKENIPLTKELEKTRKEFERFKLEQAQNPKVISFIFIYFILLWIDFMLFFSLWSYLMFILEKRWKILKDGWIFVRNHNPMIFTFLWKNDNLTDFICQYQAMFNFLHNTIWNSSYLGRLRKEGDFCFGHISKTCYT